MFLCAAHRNREKITYHLNFDFGAIYTNIICSGNWILTKKKQFFSFLDFKTTKTIPANTFSSLQFSVLLRNNIHIYTLPKAGETAVPNELTFFVDTHE